MSYIRVVPNMFGLAYKTISNPAFNPKGERIFRLLAYGRFNFTDFALNSWL